MNANELADELENTYPFVGVMEVAAIMLRQQQAEIEALKAGKIRAYDNGVEDGRKPNTNPVKEELTDEEIIKVYEDMLGVASAKGSAIDFARAILRKAQEK